jgi:CubicO group peptidase (beta-lactamase class C family)
MSAPAAPSRVAARLDAPAARLDAAARELVARGAIGVAAQLHVPGLASPRVVAAGSVDRDGSRPLTGDEGFAIASQSKMFTAAAVLLLARDGLVRLVDPVTKYVGPVPAVDQDATVAQYLNHSSGIGNFIHALTTLPWPWPSLTYEQILGLAALHGRRFRAGARLDYNNTDVVVLARLCETVAGMPLARLLGERVFAPLGMARTYIADGGDWPQEQMARGYYRPCQGYDGGEPVDVSRLPDYSIAGAAGNMVSTLPDMLAWARGLLAPDNAAGLVFGDFATGVADAGTGYAHWFFPRTCGRGVERWCWAGRSWWGHRGSFFGYHSGTFVEPISGAAFAMFMTVCTEGSFMAFIDRQGHDYMAFMESCCHAALAAAEAP